MNANDILIGVLIEESETISYTEVCQKYHLPKELLSEMMEHGLFSTKTTQVEQLKLTQQELRKIESAIRLHHDLQINLPGVVLAIELMEKIEKLNDELDILRKHF